MIGVYLLGVLLGLLAGALYGLSEIEAMAREAEKILDEVFHKEA